MNAFIRICSLCVCGGGGGRVCFVRILYFRFIKNVYSFYKYFKMVILQRVDLTGWGTFIEPAWKTQVLLIGLD